MTASDIDPPAGAATAAIDDAMTGAQVERAGQPCVRLTNGHIVVDVATAVGPRILGLSLPGGPNLLAELPDAVLHGDDGDVHLYGGHRLWRAPEVPELTWVVEDGPVELHHETSAAVTVGIEVRRPTHQGVAAEMRITLDHGRAAVTVEHRLVNDGDAPLALAPWALTMLRPGGAALLPLDRTPTDDDGLQASVSRIVLWPYTDLADERIAWRRDAVVVHTDPARGAPGATNKLGVAGTSGWCAYVLDGVVLVKRAEAAGSPVDHGATQQLFWEERCVELETLGPLAEVAPGASAVHVERWELEVVPDGDDPVLHALFVGERDETVEPIAASAVDRS